MPIRSAVPLSFKQEILDGIHDAADEYKIALFTSGANLDAKTANYDGQAGEVASGGYAKGGRPLAGRKTGLAGNIAFVTFENPRWLNATFTARGALIYNASKQNRAVAVVDFGQDHTCTNGTFVVTLPDEGANAIVSVG
jgi:hypothetical protein